MNTQLPVSKKFYSDITARISSALSFSPASATEAMRIADLYMEGKISSSSDPAAMLAFNMIRAEIDRALARSRHARERAAARRKARKEIPAEQPVIVDMEEIEPENTSDKKPMHRLSRRQRRAAQRLLKGHSGRKWLPIGGRRPDQSI